MKLMRVRVLIMVAVLLTAGASRAADVAVMDGYTLRLDGTVFRLDGIAAPERDQVCLDENGVVWACGIGAANRLADLTAKRAVQCEDKGPDPVYPNRRIGVCSVEGMILNLNNTLVLDGWALNFEPYARGRFAIEEADARDNRHGLWKGCFAAPWDFNRWRKRTAKLLGSVCPARNEAVERNKLFPDNPAMPTGCAIKGKVALRALLTGHRGIYHLEVCRSYQGLRNPNRWFCSEEEAQAAGFRKAFTCR
jgi:endonuclease YncB( thermonuclease family)